MNRRLRGLLTASLIGAVMLLPACADKKADPNASASPAPSQSATPEATPSAAPTPTKPPVTPSKDLEAIKVEGEPGKEPKVNLPAPWAVDETRTKVLTPGNGPSVDPKGTVEVNYYGVNGRTGQKFDDSFSHGQSVAFPLGQVVPGFQKGLANQKVGSRILIAMPGSDGYDKMGGNPPAIEVGDTLVFVVDVVAVPLKTAEGDVVPHVEGNPRADLVDGQMKVTLPGTPPPDKLVVQPLTRGRGKKVQPGDSITVKYQAVTWEDGKVVEDNYAKDPESGQLSTLVPAWQEGLKDQTVGSRVLIVSPPDKAYPNDPGAKKPNPSMGKHVVYVVDILFTQAEQ